MLFSDELKSLDSRFFFFSKKNSLWSFWKGSPHIPHHPQLASLAIPLNSWEDEPPLTRGWSFLRLRLSQGDNYCLCRARNASASFHRTLLSA